jgi:Nitrile hydratase, alpha chain
VVNGNVPTERDGLERRIVERALADPEFRARLLASPREAVSEELGIEVSERLEIVVVEERPDRLAIVLPVDLTGIGSDGVWAMTGRRPQPAVSARPPRNHA